LKQPLTSTPRKEPTSFRSVNAAAPLKLHSVQSCHVLGGRFRSVNAAAPLKPWVSFGKWAGALRFPQR